MNFNALIPYNNGTPQRQDTHSSLIRTGPGYLVALGLDQGGRLIDLVANFGYVGPDRRQKQIQDFFSEAEKREEALDKLHRARDSDSLETEHEKLLKYCCDLLKYALPKNEFQTQLMTFKILVDVITLYPGIRQLFYHPTGSKKSLPPAGSNFKDLWDRHHQGCGEEWTFYRDFAAYCLTDSPLTKLVESKLPSEFGRLKLLGDNLNKAPVESLLSFCGADAHYNPDKLCAIRYLTGFLELPISWRLETEEGIFIGKELFRFLSRLFETIFQLIRDIEPSGADDLVENCEDVSSPLWTSARHAVDNLVFVAFRGFLELPGDQGEEPPSSPSPLQSVVSLLTQSEMEKSFPNAYVLAPRVKKKLDSSSSSSSQNLGVSDDLRTASLGDPSWTNFLDDFDIHSVPPEFKKEGSDWSAAFNPKVKKVLDVNLVHTLEHGSVVACVRFSADGKFLATGGNRTTQIYDTKTGQRTCILVDETLPKIGDLYIRSVCFSPDGRYLAVGAEDKRIKIWDIAKMRIHSVFEGHQQEVYSLDFSPSGHFVISGSGDKTTRIWSMVDGTSTVLHVQDSLGGSDSPDRGVCSVAISPDERWVASGHMDTVARIWNIGTGKLVEELRGHEDSVYCVAFTPDGRGLVTGSLDKTLKYWDISGLSKGGGISSIEGMSRKEEKASQCTMNFTGHSNYVLSIAVSHDGAWVVSGSKDRAVQFWDARTAISQCILSGHKNSVISVDLSPMGNVLATGSGDWEARIWSYNTIRA